MATGTTERHRAPKPTSMLTYGLIFGPALGMVLALLLAGGEAISAGLVIGAGLGVAVGAIWDASRGGHTQ